MRFFFWMGLLIGILSLFFVFLGVAAFSQELASLINPAVIAVLKDVVGPVAAGFGGAIAGAYCAYLFQQKNEAEKERKNDASIVYSVTMQLSEKLNELLSIRKYNIFPYRESKIRFLEIPKLPGKPGVPDRVDRRLIDILISLDSIPVIDAVLLADAGYRACYENFASRNNGIEGYRHALQESAYGFKDEIDLREIASVVSVGRLLAINKMTEEMIDILDVTISRLRGAIEMIANATREEFKRQGVHVFGIVFPDGDEVLSSLPPPFFDREKLSNYLKTNGL